MKLLISFLVFTLMNAYANTLSLDSLKDEMIHSNSDLKILRLKKDFSKERVSQARSGYLPSLSSSLIANEGENSDPINPSSSTNSTSASSSSIPTPSSSNSNSSLQSAASRGWSADISMSLPVFNKFQVSTALENSKIDFEKQNILLAKEEQNKEIQLLQLILEINSLKAIRLILADALKLTKKIKKSPGQRNNILYSTSKKLEQEEFLSELEYQNEKVNSAWSVATGAFYDLIPTAKKDWIERLPKIKITFKEEKVEVLMDKFVKDNLGLKALQLDVDTFKNIHEQSKWERPWVPQFFLTSSLSSTRDWAGKLEAELNWSVTAVLSFSLFDGFYTEARRAQAMLSHRIAQETKKSVQSKSLINLERNFRQAQMAKARYRFMMAKVNRSKRKVKHLENISSSGVGMGTEKSAALLELSKFQWEAMDELKKYQQQLMTLAFKTNQVNKLRLKYE